MAEMRLCEWCGKGLSPVKNRFCDRSCSRSWQNSHPGEQPVRTKTCEWCGIQFPTTQKKTNRFCDKSCSAKWRMRQPEHAAKVHTEQTARKISEKVREWYAAGSPQAEAQKERIRKLNPTKDPVVRAKISR